MVRAVTENGVPLAPFENGTARVRLRDCLSSPKPAYNSERAAEPITFIIPPYSPLYTRGARVKRPPLHKGGLSADCSYILFYSSAVASVPELSDGALYKK